MQLIISSTYVAEIETMRAGKLDIGEFGPLGYVLAHQIADAQPVAAFGDKNGQPDTYNAGRHLGAEELADHEPVPAQGQDAGARQHDVDVRWPVSDLRP